MANIRFVEMSMPRTTWVKVNSLRTGVGRLHSSMHDEVSPLLKLLVRRQRGNRRSRLKSVPRIEYHVVRGLVVLDDDTRCWLNVIAASI